MTGTITRRGFIGAAAAGATLAAAHPAIAGSGSGSELLLFDPSLPPDMLMLIGRSRDETSAVELQPDVVRQWRGGLGRSIATASGAIALVRWAEAGILVGLARENGGTASVNQVATGAFEVRIPGEFPVPSP